MRKLSLVAPSLAAAIALALPLVSSAATSSGILIDRQDQDTPQRAMGLNMVELNAYKARLADHVDTDGPIKHGNPEPVLQSVNLLDKTSDNTFAATSLPAASSLEKYAPTPGDQGDVGACVTWATGYTGVGILMKEQGVNGAPMAPMYIYSQVSRGVDRGTFAGVALPMIMAQGIDTRSDYTQGDYDYTTQPTQAQRTNAKPYRLSGWYDLERVQDRTTAVKQAISMGMPVPIGFEVTQSFMRVGSDGMYNPSPGEYSVGGHEVTIVGYDQQGVTIQNSWGPRWGDQGKFHASWQWLNSDAITEIHAMGALVRN